jgi:hypothetical protein
VEALQHGEHFRGAVLVHEGQHDKLFHHRQPTQTPRAGH